MARGGARTNAGRKIGAATKKTKEIANRAALDGITPLEFMLDIMRKPELAPEADPAQQIAHQAMRFEAAKAAAPYIHAKLSSVEATIANPDGSPLDMSLTVTMVKPK